MSAFGTEKRMKYSPYVSPGEWEGDKCVFIDGILYELSPIAYRFLANFAKDNDLMLVDGVCSLKCAISMRPWRRLWSTRLTPRFDRIHPKLLALDAALDAAKHP